jgi:hypothetical protein
LDTKKLLNEKYGEIITPLRKQRDKDFVASPPGEKIGRFMRFHP